VRKAVHKKRKSTSRTRKNPQAVLFVKYITIALGAVIALVAFKFLFAATTSVHVLGTSTGPVLLARGGENEAKHEDEQEDEHENPEPPHVESNSDSGNQNSSGTSQPANINQSNNSQSTPSSDTKVDCVGPDGKHFVTSFHDCQELNSKWGKKSFQFTKV
jgi:hypothetical protein